MTDREEWKDTFANQVPKDLYIILMNMIDKKYFPNRVIFEEEDG